MKIKEILAKYTIILKENKLITSPNLEAELLLSFALKKTREYLFSNLNKTINNSQVIKFNVYIQERLLSKPMAYIIGHKEFYGLDFNVNKNTLIPRPETELIIDELKHILDERLINNNKPIIVIDIGTGSGCIITTITKLFKKNKNIRFIASDISSNALQVAMKNAKKHNTDKQIDFLEGNLLEPIINNHRLDLICSDLFIISNLPYLTPTQVKNSPTIQHEPKTALISGSDGLKHYKELFTQLKSLLDKDLKQSNNQIIIMCEIDPSQSNTIQSLISRKIPSAKFRIKKDLARQDRLAIIQIINN
ncbi:peptide chain release factor N(5)-glutamine methyltransferase [Patescibacteria group bacterium]|nr:peptide chain release factor N(5)-glutamine methyltransferase [Patescibacteria group bacterium]